MAEVYKVTSGNYTDYVQANSMSQALLCARAIWGERATISAELASPEEVNALLRAHSLPTTE